MKTGDYFFVLHPKGNYGAVPFSLLAEDDNVWIAQSVPLNTYESSMRHVFRKFDYVACPAGPAVVAELNKARAAVAGLRKRRAAEGAVGVSRAQRLLAEARRRLVRLF